MPLVSNLILLNCPEVIDFLILLKAVEKTDLTAVSDVWPLEPVPKDYPVRELLRLLKPNHFASALQKYFEEMGQMVWNNL